MRGKEERGSKIKKQPGLEGTFKDHPVPTSMP